MKKSFRDALAEECSGILKEEERLSSHTSIKIGGVAEVWYEPSDETSLARAIQLTQNYHQPLTVIGGGSNVLVPDEGLRGLVVHLNAPFFKELKQIAPNRLMAGAAVPLNLFLRFLIEQGFAECEFLMGIPAQVGGAVAMNAGSSERWIGSYLKTGRLIDPKGNLKIFSHDDAKFSYRKSGLLGSVVTCAEFEFPKENGHDTRKRLEEYSDHRRKTQDLTHPSVGCMFSNPPEEGKSAGYLIEAAGLKGKTIGGAKISDIHANFVINVNRASHRDVLSLLELVQKEVSDQFGIQLKREIKVLS